MKTISASPYVAGEPSVLTTECGQFTVEMTSRGYSQHIYSVKKISGEWPSKDELGRWLDHRWDYFGGTATINEDSASVTCYVN